MPVPRPTLIERLIGWVMRLFFWNLYHRYSWTYDFVAKTVSVGRWNRWVATAAGQVRGPRVLELGFGPGHLQAQLRRQGFEVYGLDESHTMARQASRRLRRAGFVPEVARGLAQALPFPAQQFDSVVATFPTSYIVDPHTLAEVRRLLKPDGQLVILLAAWITGRRLADRLMRLVFAITGQVPPSGTTLNQFTDPYRKAGFSAETVYVDLQGSRLLFVIAHPAPSNA